MELGGDEESKAMKSPIGICSLSYRFLLFPDFFSCREAAIIGRGNIFHEPKLVHRGRHAGALDWCQFFLQRPMERFRVPRFVHVGVTRAGIPGVLLSQKRSKSMYFVSLKGTHTKHKHVPTYRRPTRHLPATPAPELGTWESASAWICLYSHITTIPAPQHIKNPSSGH